MHTSCPGGFFHISVPSYWFVKLYRVQLALSIISLLKKVNGAVPSGILMPLIFLIAHPCISFMYVYLFKTGVCTCCDSSAHYHLIINYTSIWPDSKFIAVYTYLCAHVFIEHNFAIPFWHIVECAVFHFDKLLKEKKMVTLS